tara:strand:- start:2 stop:385 length:384 start_codon:yes stop_codon:yes gene_type:complete
MSEHHIGKNTATKNMRPQELRDSEGKPLCKSFQNTITKLVQAGKLSAEVDNKTTAYDDYQEIVDDPHYVLVNPFSGKQRQVYAMCYDICKWITSSNPVVKPFTQSDWDNARYIVNVCWPEVYYAIVD